MKNHIALKVHVAALCLAAVFLLACTQKWQIKVISADSLGPTLCFSHGKECDDEGIQLNTISVREVGPKGDAVDTAWLLQGASHVSSDYIVRSLKYGSLPKGWSELSPAKAIKANAFYSLNDEYYFVRDENNKYKVYSREEFFSK